MMWIGLTWAFWSLLILMIMRRFSFIQNRHFKCNVHVPWFWSLPSWRCHCLVVAAGAQPRPLPFCIAVSQSSRSPNSSWHVSHLICQTAEWSFSGHEGQNFCFSPVPNLTASGMAVRMWVSECFCQIKVNCKVLVQAKHRSFSSTLPAPINRFFYCPVMNYLRYLLLKLHNCSKKKRNQKGRFLIIFQEIELLYSPLHCWPCSDLWCQIMSFPSPRMTLHRTIYTAGNWTLQFGVWVSTSIPPAQHKHTGCLKALRKLHFFV